MTSRSAAGPSRRLSFRTGSRKTRARIAATRRYDDEPLLMLPLRVAGEAAKERPFHEEARALATKFMPQLAFDAKKPTGWAVQLGAYDSLGIAKEKWGSLKSRNAMLANFPASSHAATVNGRNFYRLTVNGLATRADASSLCHELKAQGQICFVRAMGGGEAIQWAAKAGPMPR